MINLLRLLLVYLAEKVLSFAFKRLLWGAGLGLVAYGVSQGLYNMLLSYVQSNFANLASFFYLIDLTGLDIAISLVLSAVAMRMLLNAGRFTLRKF